MAGTLSGFKNTDFANGFLRLAMEWTATQNIPQNYSTVTVNLYLQGLTSSSTINASASNDGYITINGVKKVFKSTSAITGTQKKLLSSAITNVYHDSDGTKIFNIDTGFNVNVTFSGVEYDWQYVKGNFELKEIPRQSNPTLSGNEFNIGTDITVFTNRSSSAYVHTLKYKFGNATGVISENVGLSAVFSVPKTFANQIPNNINGTGQVICETYSAGTLIGTSAVSFIAWIPETTEFKPSISKFEIAEFNAAIATKFQSYIQRKSQLDIKTEATGAYSSTIASYKIETNGQVFSTKDATSANLTNAGQVPIKLTATDSRGRTITQTQNITVLAYGEPVVTALVANRANNDGSLNEEGNYAKVDIVASISSLSDKNDKTFILKYKKSDEIIYTEVALTSVYDLNESRLLSNIDVDNSYDIQIVAQDFFSTTTRQIELSTGYTLLDLYRTGKGIAFGKVAEKEGAEFGMPVDFKDQVNIYAPTSTEADGGLFRLRRSDGTIIAFVATGEGGTGLNVHLYSKATNAQSGTIRINEDGSIFTTGSITASI